VYLGAQAEATVDEATSLKSAVESMRKRQYATVPVVAGGRVVGLLTLENVSEMMMVNAAMDHQRRRPAADGKTKHQHL